MWRNHCCNGAAHNRRSGEAKRSTLRANSFLRLCASFRHCSPRQVYPRNHLMRPVMPPSSQAARGRRCSCHLVDNVIRKTIKLRVLKPRKCHRYSYVHRLSSFLRSISRFICRFVSLLCRKQTFVCHFVSLL